MALIHVVLLNALLVRTKISRNSAFLGSDKARMLFFAHNCWHFNIYERGKFHAQLS